MTDGSETRRRGLMLVLSSPSGAGKSSLSRMLLAQDDDLTLSISVTTRPRRPSEVDGVHYHFIDRPRFTVMRSGGELLESAEVHGNLYATPRASVEQALAAGRDVLFDIDWQGTQQLKAAMPDDLVAVFVLPPSMRELRARLERRAEDSSEVIEQRLANARSEMEHWREYDYVIVNHDLQTSNETVQRILAAERQVRADPSALLAEEAARYSRDRQPDLPDFVRGLLSEPETAPSGS
ncbi:guanylate kinase [Bauldia sp.]|uniref:guanylate kinase n=1 Tax=Bauldia sp. TaxID=2575872 RepID=UPI003BAC9F21